MKKTILIIAVVLLLCSVFTCVVFAADNSPTITVGTVSAAPGETVTLDVSISDNPGIVSFTLGFDYDTSRLALRKFELDPGLGGMVQGTKEVTWLNDVDTTYNGVILTLTFDVLSDAEDGDAKVAVTYEEGDICNRDEEDVNFSLVAGKVAVAHKHTWDSGKITKAATCKEEGVKTYTCTVCKTTKTEKIDKLTTHTWDEGKVTKAATCKEEGVKTYTCTVCKTTKKEKIAKDPDNHADYGTEEKGWSLCCKGCGASLGIIKLDPSVWSDEITTAATCVSTGIRTYTSSINGDTKTDVIPIDPTNHVRGTEIRDAKAATCNEDGYTGDTYCKGCGAKIADGKTVSAGHAWDEGKVTKEATSEKEGVMTYTCTVCGATKTEPIPIKPVVDIKTGDLVTFGSYPQSLVTDAALLETLNSQSLEWKSYDYYIDETQNDYMAYSDITLSGVRYRAVRFSLFRPEVTHLRSNRNNSFQDDNGYEPFTVYWFKYEPVVWRVLDSQTGLLVTENIIDSQAFHNVVYSVEGNDNSLGDYAYGDKSHTHYSSNWAYSDLRSWLNNDFYDTAFDVEKNSINETDLSTSSWGGEEELNADPTTDKVFLLGVSDVLNESYGFKTGEQDKDEKRIALGTDYARCQGLYVNDEYSDFGWLLRTPCGYNYLTVVTEKEGIVRGGYNAPLTCLGIRPAISIDLQSEIGYSLISITNDSGLVIHDPVGIKNDKQIFGDVNGDGDILANDARLALRASAKLEELTDVQFLAADVDGNGNVFADDARQILRYSAKLQLTFPVA